jgi:diguanylate cyclase (GGDEF)-like protein
MISHLGRYEIIGELGRGAMGIVYKAKDPLIERVVALKSINLHGMDNRQKTEYEARFYQEAKAAGRLNHTNIVTIHDLGNSDDVAYIAMELMEGRELHNVIGDKRRLPINETLNITCQVADALAFAHQHSIVHRDIKPSNIMVLSNGHVKIADFGIAKLDSSSLTQVGMIMGSPLYMSPEQVRGASITSQSDIFSLGIVLYELLTGRRPFSGDNANSVMRQIAHEIPPKPSSLNPDIPGMLDDIVSKCLEKNPVDRYKNAKKLADDLRLCRETLLHSKVQQNSHFLNSKQLKRFAIPGGVSQNFVLISFYLAIGAIFLLDEITDATIQMHMLYLLPLIMIGFHCERVRLVHTAVMLALLLQGIHLVTDAIPIFSKSVLAVLILTSNILVVYMARIARTNIVEVGHLASFDGLTGLRNRLSFESITEMEIERQKRHGGVFSFAVIDFDNFKYLNDSRGYLAGDEALKLLANILREHIRPSDTIARIGGDEFAILMPGSDADDCESFCKQLSVKVANRMVDASFPVSTSIGYVTFEQAPASIAEAFDMTEKAMHVAQKGDKGHVVGGLAT